MVKVRFQVPTPDSYSPFDRLDILEDIHKWIRENADGTYLYESDWVSRYYNFELESDVIKFKMKFDSYIILVSDLG